MVEIQFSSPPPPHPLSIPFLSLKVDIICVSPLNRSMLFGVNCKFLHLHYVNLKSPKDFALKLTLFGHFDIPGLWTQVLDSRGWMLDCGC